MKRSLVWIAIILLVSLAACRKTGAPQPSDPEVNESGHFLSDSLGVSLYLPDSPGWSYRRDPPVPGGPYITAVHDGNRATVRLFVNPTTVTPNLEKAIEVRRTQLASSFGVKSLDEVISQVLHDGNEAWDGHPAMQWQAVSEVISMEEIPSRIMFTWLATERQDYVYECLAMVLFADQPTPEEKAVIDALMRDTTEIMQSFRLR